MRPTKHRANLITNFQIVSLLKIAPYRMPKFGGYWIFSYLCTSNRKKASLVPDVGLHRRQTLVLIDDRRRSSMTTKIRARNGGFWEIEISTI